MFIVPYCITDSEMWALSTLHQRCLRHIFIIRRKYKIPNKEKLRSTGLTILYIFTVLRRLQTRREELKPLHCGVGKAYLQTQQMALSYW